MVLYHDRPMHYLLHYGDSVTAAVNINVLHDVRQGNRTHSPSACCTAPAPKAERFAYQCAGESSCVLTMSSDDKVSTLVAAAEDDDRIARRRVHEINKERLLPIRIRLLRYCVRFVCRALRRGTRESPNHESGSELKCYELHLLMKFVLVTRVILIIQHWVKYTVSINCCGYLLATDKLPPSGARETRARSEPGRIPAFASKRATSFRRVMGIRIALTLYRLDDKFTAHMCAACELRAWGGGARARTPDPPILKSATLPLSYEGRAKHRYLDIPNVAPSDLHYLVALKKHLDYGISASHREMSSGTGRRFLLCWHRYLGVPLEQIFGQAWRRNILEVELMLDFVKVGSNHEWTIAVTDVSPVTAPFPKVELTNNDRKLYDCLNTAPSNPRRQFVANVVDSLFMGSSCYFVSRGAQMAVCHCGQEVHLHFITRSPWPFRTHVSATGTMLHLIFTKNGLYEESIPHDEAKRHLSHEVCSIRYIEGTYRYLQGFVYWELANVARNTSCCIDGYRFDRHSREDDEFQNKWQSAQIPDEHTTSATKKSKYNIGDETGGEDDHEDRINENEHEDSDNVEDDDSDFLDVLTHPSDIFATTNDLKKAEDV
ncbi:hypothetical protein PR048_010980 [Dryococelus australis]|uniref:Uncharacterized protein n=1 Tax=Dryococelus australis TaxID=614101 RepID=A0ABQ9HKU1_9NEOP|nr:hypothetical protein PR048_010980 [Dryococelus australis]